MHAPLSIPCVPLYVSLQSGNCSNEFIGMPTCNWLLSNNFITDICGSLESDASTKQIMSYMSRIRSGAWHPLKNHLFSGRQQTQHPWKSQVGWQLQGGCKNQFVFPLRQPELRKYFKINLTTMQKLCIIRKLIKRKLSQK